MRTVPMPARASSAAVVTIIGAFSFASPVVGEASAAAVEEAETVAVASPALLAATVVSFLEEVVAAAAGFGKPACASV